MKIRQKVNKVFDWRAFLNGPPTKSNLKMRKVLEDCTYQLCSNYVENTAHALIHFTSLQEGWLKQNPSMCKLRILTWIC